MANLGSVYFIRAGALPSVKIGWAKDPWARLATLQTGCPQELRLLGHLPGTQPDERSWHKRFASERGRGEWFKLSADLRGAINRALAAEGATCFQHLSVLSDKPSHTSAQSVHGRFCA